MTTGKQLPFLVLVVATLAGMPAGPAFAQDREGRIESTLDRIETRRRLQQYKNEDSPAAAPVVQPIAPVSQPRVQPRTAVQPRSEAARSAASIKTFQAESAVGTPPAKRSKPRPTAAIAPSAAVRQTLPRD